MTQILIGKGKIKTYILPKMLNRHGVIAGATGTGKTVTLKVIAEQLSLQGIPVFLSDVKGDLGSLLKPGSYNESVEKRVKEIEIEDYEFQGFPVEYFDIFKEEGTTIRSTISQMGPIMLTRLLGLNDTQYGVLGIAFQIADENNWELDDLKDLRALLNYIQENASEFSKIYGNITKATIGSIMRSLLIIEQQGGNYFFGKPSFDVQDFLSQQNGLGVINVLNAKKLLLAPQLYASFLFWMLSELFESLPEVGDLEKPKMVFFFDEAHVLFTDDNKILLEKIELLVRLIRSKGVGIFFVTQNPQDIPDSISSQLGTRIQHGLRAFSPKELKDVKAIAATFRSDDSFDIEQSITNLGVGEAIVSTLDEKGIPTFADKVIISPPRSLMGVISPQDVLQAVNNSRLFDKYYEDVESFSAYEAIAQQQTQKNEQTAPTPQNEQSQQGGGIGGFFAGLFGGGNQKQTTRRTDSMTDRFTKNVMSSVGREVGRQIIRGIFGTKR